MYLKNKIKNEARLPVQEPAVHSTLAVSRIRTWVLSATTRSTNRYTNTAICELWERVLTRGLFMRQ